MGLYAITFFWLFVILPLSAVAAPYAALVMDARTGEVLHARNADTRLHPASLTKMMTLYIVFQAVERGEISLDTDVRISRNAASEPPSKLGLRAGQTIKLRYLIRAAAVKSANDAATALGEALEGSEAAFARRMNRTAKALGMTRTTFKNAHGLTESGHMSTARDMTILGRHVIYDFPQYYNLFSRRSTDAGIRSVSNTNRRLLDAYKGADGIKTGYTRAAGFNLVASAERGNERVIATVFGGRSTASRNAKVAELLDLGFRRSPSTAPLDKPDKPAYVADADPETPAEVAPGSVPGGKGKTIRVSGLVQRSLRPNARPGSTLPAPAVVAMNDALKDVVEEVRTAPVTAPVQVAATPVAAVPVAALSAPAPGAAPVQLAAVPRIEPRARPAGLREDDEVQLASAALATRPEPQQREVVTRISTSGGRHWGINVGRFPSQYAAEKMLLKTALAEMATLDGALRKVNRKPQGFDANFMGLSREAADLACRRLQARAVTCFMIGPG